MSVCSSNQKAGLGSIALLIISMLSVQVGAALAKGMFKTVGAMGTVTFRVVIAAIMLMVALRPWRVKRNAHSWRMVLLYGISVGAMNILMYAALQRIPLGIAVALEFTGPLAVALLASRRSTDFVWITLAVAGLVALLPLGDVTSNVDPVGVALALGAGVCWALYIVFGRKAGADHGLSTAAIGMAIAALIVLPVGFSEASRALFLPGVLLTAFGVATLSSALPYTLEMYALPRLPAKTFGTLMSVEPAIGALCGLFLLGEHLTPRQWIGITLIIATSIGTTLTAVRSTLTVPAEAS